MITKESLRIGLFVTVGAFGLAVSPAGASGHGPVFGFATPTNAEEGWQVDFMSGARK